MSLLHYFLILAVVFPISLAQQAWGDVNPFLYPNDGYNFTIGEEDIIRWEPTTNGTVTINLYRISKNTSSTIADSIENTGSYPWTPTSSVKTDEDYQFQIVDDDSPEDFSLSPSFSIPGNGGSDSLSTGAKAAIGVVVPLVVIAILIVAYMYFRRHRNQHEVDQEVNNEMDPRREAPAIEEMESPHGGSNVASQRNNDGPVLLGIEHGPDLTRFPSELHSAATGSHARSSSAAQDKSAVTSPSQADAAIKSSAQAPPPASSEKHSPDAQSHNRTSNVSSSAQPNPDPISDEGLPEVYEPASRNPVEQYQELQRLRLERERARNRVSNLYRLQTLEQQIIDAQQEERSVDEMIRQRERALATTDERRQSTSEPSTHRD